MKEYIIRISIACALMIVLIAGFSLASTNTDSLSNEMLAWGFRRSKNHEQPVLDGKSQKVLKEYNGGLFHG